MPLLQVYELEGYRVTHAQKYPGPILSLDIAPDCSTLAVGQADGLLCLRKHSALKAAAIGAGGTSACSIRDGRPVERQSGLVTEGVVRSAGGDLCLGKTLFRSCSHECRWALVLSCRPWSIHTSSVCRRTSLSGLHTLPRRQHKQVAASSPPTYAFRQALFTSGLPAHPCRPLQRSNCVCRWGSIKEACPAITCIFQCPTPLISACRWGSPNITYHWHCPSPVIFVCRRGSPQAPSLDATPDGRHSPLLCPGPGGQA